jgi:hypothetical protein
MLEELGARHTLIRAGPAANERRRRGPPWLDRRGVLAAGLCPLPVRRFTAKRDLERYLGDYKFAPPPRPPSRRPDPGRDRLRNVKTRCVVTVGISATAD